MNSVCIQNDIVTHLETSQLFKASKRPLICANVAS